jgi:hypothetical protein
MQPQSNKAIIDVDWEGLKMGKPPFGTLQSLQSKIGGKYWKIDERYGYINNHWDWGFYTFSKQDEIDIIFLQHSWVIFLGIDPENSKLTDSMTKIYHVIENNLGVFSSKWYKWKDGFPAIIIKSSRGAFYVSAQGETLDTFHAGKFGIGGMDSGLDVIIRDAATSGDFNP